MNQVVALAYCQENKASVDKILLDFKNTNIQFKLVSANSHAEPSIYNQLENCFSFTCKLNPQLVS
jgi:hypothetical protein